MRSGISVHVPIRIGRGRVIVCMAASISVGTEVERARAA